MGALDAINGRYGRESVRPGGLAKRSGGWAYEARQPLRLLHYPRRRYPRRQKLIPKVQDRLDAAKITDPEKTSEETDPYVGRCFVGQFFNRRRQVEAAVTKQAIGTPARC